MSMTALHGGIAQAHEEPRTFVNNTQILSCLNIEVLDLPIASVSGNNIDCSGRRG
ncbi:hypothetical protein [Streptomyces sp. NPDC006384]|uniref:hypothetical protein n=1 Tax=Streptomyces sp. NPDC006384 TaxID=3364745 RepID=UPI0036785EB8